MKNKKFRLMAGAFIFIFVAVTLAWQIPRVSAAPIITLVTASGYEWNYPTIFSANQIKMKFSTNIASCDSTKIYIDVGGGGLGAWQATGCTVDTLDATLVYATFAGDPWWHDNTTTYAAANGLYLLMNAVTGQDANVNVVLYHSFSVAISNASLAYMSSVTKDSATQITVTMSAMLEGGGCQLAGGDSCGFTVADTANPGTTYAISGNAQGLMTQVVLTVADFSASAGNGITVTYNGDSNALSATENGNNGIFLKTDSVGLSIAGWQAPSMVSAVVNSATQITVALDEAADGDTIIKSNDGGFSVYGGADGSSQFLVTAVTPGSGYLSVILTVADMSASAAYGVTVKYTAGVNGTVADADGNAMVTDAVGVVAPEFLPPTLSSAVVNSNTQITVTLSEVASAGTITKSNDGGFVVTKTGALTTYAVSAVAPGATNAKAVLTVANMSGAAATGVTVTYVQGGALPGQNGAVTDANSNAMVTDAVGVAAPEFTPPTLSSAVRNSDTQITVTLSEVAAHDTIVKSNDGGFVVTQLNSATTFAVSAIAHGETNDLVVLTVANMSAAGSAGVKVTYSSGARPGDNGTVTDANGNYLATDETGVSIVAWSTGRRSFPSPTTTTTTTTTDTTSVGTTIKPIAPIVVVPPTTVTVGFGQTVTTTVPAQGTTASISFGGSLGFSFGGASHHVSVGNVNVSAGTASVRLQSTPIDLDLKVGEPQQVDLDGDGVKDMEVTLDEIISVNDLKITMKPLQKAAVEEPKESQKTSIDYTDGKWVKVLNNSAVYFIDKSNVRHIYLTQTIWASYFGKDFSKVQIVPTVELLNYATGASVPFESGVLVKTPTSPKVYKVDVDGSLQWIKDEAAAVRLIGADWAKKVIDISEEVLREYTIGLTLE